MTSGAIFGGNSASVRHRMYSTLALILAKSSLVSKPSKARRKMISELASHLAAQFAAWSRIAAARAAGSGKTRRQGGLDAVALQCLDPDVGQHRLARRLSVIAAAMPFGIAGEPRLQLGQLLIGIDRGPGRGVDRHDRIDEIGVGDRPLKRLVAAIGGTGDRDQMADAEMVEQGFL